MIFASPVFLLLLLFIPLYLLLHWKLKGRSLKFSSLDSFDKLPKSWRVRFAWLPRFLALAALALFILALARPQGILEKSRRSSEGIAIMVVVDRSGSMREGMRYGIQKMRRLDVVKQVFRDFILGNKEGLSGRPDDLIGLVSFARYPETLAPLTLSHRTLAAFSETLEIVTNRLEDGTAIGDAISLAAARLHKAEEELSKMSAPDLPENYNIKSKIIILLTDGQNNVGQFSPEEASKTAAKWGIKVYTVGIGNDPSKGGIMQLFSGGANVDTATLKTIARETGGQFALAASGEELLDIYSQIDKLEKSRWSMEEYTEYREYFLFFALSGFIMLCLFIILKSLIFRSLPE